MNDVFSGYIEHNDAKSEGETGFLRRKWLEINKDSIRYIGKESNELEKSEYFGVFKEDTLEYVDFQKRLREIIRNLTLEKALDKNISRRTYFDWKKKISEDKSLKLKNSTMSKLF